MNLENLLEAKVSLAKMKPISKFPTVTRDLALIVKKDVATGDLIKAIKKCGCGLVKDARVFDVYEGDKISSWARSVAISITLGKEGTLTDKEITDTLDKIKYELSTVFGAELRM